MRPHLRNDMHQLEMAQHRAARFIKPDNNYDSSVSQMLQGRGGEGREGRGGEGRGGEGRGGEGRGGEGGEGRGGEGRGGEIYRPIILGKQKKNE